MEAAFTVTTTVPPNHSFTLPDECPIHLCTYSADYLFDNAQKLATVVSSEVVFAKAIIATRYSCILDNLMQISLVPKSLRRLCAVAVHVQ